MGETTSTFDPGSISDGDEVATTVTVNGASLGHIVLVSFDVDVADLALTADVTSSDTVTVVLHNSTGGTLDLASGTLRIRVIDLGI